MKNFQRLSAVALLTLALASPVLAGDISTWNTEPPPPPPNSSETTEGDIHIGAAGDIHTWNIEANASSIEAILGLLQSVMPLF